MTAAPPVFGFNPRLAVFSTLSEPSIHRAAAMKEGFDVKNSAEKFPAQLFGNGHSLQTPRGGINSGMDSDHNPAGGVR